MRMSQLRDLCADRPALVLGGGPSLPIDYKRALDRIKPKSRPVLIAVNYHAEVIGIKTHYMVYNDQPESDPLLWQAAKDYDGLRVSPDPTSDVQFDVDVWTGYYSSNTAAWFALWLGCNPVILCGMDCYQGLVKYCHDVNREHSPSWDYPLDDHLRPWREEGLHRLPHVDRLRVASGPLVEIFPLFE